jgi:hypothetical protein
MERSLELGLMSAVRCTRSALPWLRKAEWARIVNVSAHSTRRQSPTLIGYTAAKSALTSVSKNLAKTLAPEKILVNTVSPGTFLSGGVRSWLEGMAAKRGLDPESLDDLNRVIEEDFGHPCDLGRAGLPDEIGAVIAFPRVAPQQLHDRRQRETSTAARTSADGGGARCRRADRGCARAKTGLQDLGDETYFREALDVLLADVARAELSELGGMVWRGRIQGHLRRAAARRGLDRSSPRRARARVPAPIFVIGLPRTGTTALSHLLAQDPDTRSLRVFEAADPVPAARGRVGGRSARRGGAERNLTALHQLSPQLAAMHEDTATGPTENQDLLGMSFRTFHFEAWRGSRATWRGGGCGSWAWGVAG